MQKTVHKISLKYQLKSFGWAIAGLSYFFRSDLKKWFDFFGSILVIVTGLGFGFNKTDWVFIILDIGNVFRGKILTKILERISDFNAVKDDVMRGRV